MFKKDVVNKTSEIKTPFKPVLQKFLCDVVINGKTPGHIKPYGGLATLVRFRSTQEDYKRQVSYVVISPLFVLLLGILQTRGLLFSIIIIYTHPRHYNILSY